MKTQTQLINEFIKKNHSLSYGELSDRIKTELGYDVTSESIRKRYTKMKLPAKKITSQNKDVVSEPDAKVGLEVRGEHIVINWTTKTIITELGEFGQMLCSFDMHSAIQRAYVNMDGNNTAAIVAMKFDFPHAKAVHQYAKHHGFTKSSLPQTDLEFEMGLTTEEAVQQNIQAMKRETYKKTEQAKWKLQQDAANKWFDFHNNVLKPFENYVEEHISKREPVKYIIPKGIKKADYNALVGITDVHYMKLCVDDFGKVIYNRDIAREKLFATQQELIQNIMLFGKPEKFTIIVGTDNIHVDNPMQTTTKGTFQANQTEGSWHVEIGNYVDMQLDYIDMYASIAPVDVVVAPGNHDKNTSYLLGAFLKKHYERTSKTVKVTQSLNSERTYIPYGDNSCFVIEHGDSGSLVKRDANIHKIIMSEASSWGIKVTGTMFYYVSGDLHHENVKDLGGNVLRIVLPAFCPPDQWHTLSGYVGTTLQSMVTLIGKTKGRFATLYV